MPAADLRHRAATTHVVVIGAGIAGLVAARECAKLGFRVTVLDAAEEPGGTIRRARLGDLTVDTGAEGFSARGEAVQQLIDDLGLGEKVVVPVEETAWVSGIPGVGAAPLPQAQLCGIPANPFDERVRGIIGWRGSWRAYSDRLRGSLRIGHETSLGRLVSSRMGTLVLERLLAPRSRGVWVTHPDDIRTDAAAPGLNAALTRSGSLSGAVASLIAASTLAPAVLTVTGGMYEIVGALIAELEHLGAELRLAAPVQAIARAGGGWAVSLPDDDGEGTAQLSAEGVIVATDEGSARALLGDILPEAPPMSVEVELVTLLVESQALDAAPRGAEVFPLAGSSEACGLTHSTAKWGWLAEAATGRHLLRVTFAGERPATAVLDDAEAADLAAAEARVLTGAADILVRAARRERFSQGLPESHLSAYESRLAVRAASRAVTGLAVVGGWVAGAGLARVIPDAQGEAERLRRALLWEDADAGTSQQP